METWSIIADKRESRAGWRFESHDVEVSFEHLVTADYTIRNYLGIDCRDFFCIERKELRDLVGSCTNERERLEKEHERLKTIVDNGGEAHLIIEGSPSGLAFNFPEQYNSIIGTSLSWPKKYGVTWHWAGDKQRSMDIAYWLMEKANYSSSIACLKEARDRHNSRTPNAPGCFVNIPFDLGI